MSNRDDKTFKSANDNKSLVKTELLSGQHKQILLASRNQLKAASALLNNQLPNQL